MSTTEKTPEKKPVALVTGATRGIGQAIGRALAKAGYYVVGTATSPAGAEAISADLAAAGLYGRGAVLDVTDASACQAFVTALQGEFGALAVLVNNAGITRDNLALRMRDEEWDAVIRANLDAVFRMSRLVMGAMMKARHGRIINITSVVGAAGNPGQVNYAAAKAGVTGMTRVLAQELGPRQVTVNCIAPGLIDTDMTRNLPEAQQQALLAKIPLRRWGKPEEVADLVTFLASPAAAYISGTTVHINGGMFMP